MIKLNDKTLSYFCNVAYQLVTNLVFTSICCIDD